MMQPRRIALFCIIAAVALLACHTCEAMPSGDALYRAYRGAIPANVFERMESDCRAMSEYEARGATLKDGKRVTRWMPVGAFPRTALEEAILHLVHLAKPGPSLVGFEWWIQQIGEENPLGFHVDKDESVASNEHYLLHPIWSSVFYVTAEGGGTLITNQHSPHGSGYEPASATEAAWSFPEPNKFLLFNGTLLHGVVPGSRRGALPRERITFLVNFWHVRPKEPNCQTLEHEKVPGLTLLSRQEILALREEERVRPSPKAKRQPMANIDLTPGSTTPMFPFRIELPGGGHQIINLPDLKVPTAGQTYSLQYQPRPKKAKRQTPTPAAATAAAAATPQPQQASAAAAAVVEEEEEKDSSASSKTSRRSARRERERREAAEIAAQLEERRLRREAEEVKKAARRARRQARKEGKAPPAPPTPAPAATAAAAAPQKPAAKQKGKKKQTKAAPEPSQAKQQQQQQQKQQDPEPKTKKLSQKEKRAARRAARAARRKQREAEEAAALGLDAAVPSPPLGVFSTPRTAGVAPTPVAAPAAAAPAAPAAPAARAAPKATTPPTPPAAAAAPPAATPANSVLQRLDAARAVKDALRRTLDKQ